MKRWLGLVMFVLLGSLHAQEADYAQLKADAEKQYTAGSYARARELYLKAEKLELSKEEKRWVDFRLADSLWRSQAATETADPTVYEKAQQQLEVLVLDIRREEERDRVWAEVEESLGDFRWLRRDARDWSQAWPHYQKALDWWAGAPVTELARDRYLGMVWKMAKPPRVEPYYIYGYYGNAVPLEVLQNALKIARTQNDQSHLHYLIAMASRHKLGGPGDSEQVSEEFEAALEGGRMADWYDDALFHYAEWLSNMGRVIILRNGQSQQQPDYPKAVELFQRLLKEFKKGETRYYDEAKNRLAQITKPSLHVNVSNIFLPDSEIQFHLNWRNLKNISLNLYKVDLTEDVKLSAKKNQYGDWIQAMDLSKAKKFKSWIKDTEDRGDYKPGQEQVRFEEKLPKGAYILEARGDGQSSRDLLLVTDVALVLKTSGKQALVYFCNALNGAPVPEAKVRLWERYHNGQTEVWQEVAKQTGADGLCVFDLKKTQNSQQLLATAALGDRQAFSTGYSAYSYRQEQPWKIYAMTDRPAYRPGETVQWKLVARQYNGSVYSTPAHQTIEFEIHDPRGSKIKEGKAPLNEFGSAWGSLELSETMPLGEYRVTFWDQGRKNSIGYATLFRLEEYKLPEFKVSVRVPEENGKKKAFVLGEKVEASIQADYYFGGPVANATVEVLVYQNPFYHVWRRPHPFPWLYEDMHPRPYDGGRGPIVKRETLKTDALGKATLVFDTPRGIGQDLEYEIEARVTDSSRHEIVGSDRVRVTGQRYYAHLNPEHYLYRPQDKVSIRIKTVDANDQPVQAEGEIKVTRDYWYEIWIDPNEKEVKGEELNQIRDRIGIFPPPPAPDQRGWRLKFRGYEHDEIFTRGIKTDADGEAEVAFTPEREGYYRAEWTSGKKEKRPVRGETTVWVADHATTELGYHQGGLEIIADKDTFRAGQKAPVLLSVPTNDRYVLFSVEGDDLYSYQLVHVTGSVKLVEVPIEEKHVPNIFLSGFMVSDRKILTDTEPVVVPPVQNFLNVEVRPDREQYQPREEGAFTIITRDHEDKPVSAEVALSLVDESVFYIQEDYAGDPRQFFFGTKRPLTIQTQSTFQQKNYAKWVEGEGDRLVDELSLSERDSGRRSELSQNGFCAEGEMVRSESADFIGGVAALADAKLAQAPAPALEMKSMGASPTAEDFASASDQAVQVRSDFRSTVFWQPDVITGEDGKAVVKVKYPDSLTGWKATARVASAGNQFGMTNSLTRTKQPLIVRLEAPRFFVVGDRPTISAVVNNNTEKTMIVKTSLEAQGLAMGNSKASQSVEVPANGEARVDWPVEVKEVGTARLKVTGHGTVHSDAMEKEFAIYEHGIPKLISRSGKPKGDEIRVKLDLPKERKAGSTQLTVQLAPSMAVTMLDALPYLIQYPYGCTEQTMSRFLPAVVAGKTLKELGLSPEEAMSRVFGGIEPANAAQTHSSGKKDLRQMEDAVQKGLKRLYDFQHGDGGWGWWKEGESDHFMTAYVVWGLTLARDAGVSVKNDILDRGVQYLDKEIAEEEANYDVQAWMLHALSNHHLSSKKSAASKFQSKALENLWKNRDRLNAYTRALLALSAHQFGDSEKAKALVENLENGVKRDDAPDTSIIQEGGQVSQEGVMGTAHWGEDGFYWRWSEGPIEGTCFALRALLAIDPQNKLIEPVVNWLVKNRRGAQWSNTRDTAMAVLALNDYLRKSGELVSDLEYELSVNGHSVVKKKIGREDVLNAPSAFAIHPDWVRDGSNEIRIRRSGKGPVYFAAQATFFSLEEPIPPAGNEIFVRREYYKLVGQPTLLKGYVYKKELLRDGEIVASGDRVQVVLTIEAKNNGEYLVFEDLKPAGLEAVEIRSGESLYARELKSGAVERRLAPKKDGPTSSKERKASNQGAVRMGRPGILPPPRNEEGTDYTGRTRWVYQELRDRKIALFIDKLPEGVWEIRYDLRAETPGLFHALPVLGHAMYVPEIRCNGSEIRLRVEDRK